MGIELLPDELQLSLSQQFPCREAQIRQLSAYLSRSKPSPSTLVLYGPQATGKTTLLRSFLDEGKFSHAVVRCRECVSGRQLLERTIGAVREGLIAEQTVASGRGGGGGGSVAVELGAQGKCENLGVLVVALQGLMEKRERLLREQGIVDGRGGKFVLVFDGVDVVREAPPTLLPALGRLGEFVPNLTTVLILRHPSPRFLHQVGVPQIYFPPYTREQSIHILSQTPLDIFLSNPSNSNSNNSDNNNPSNNNDAYKPREDYDEEVHAEDKAWLWPRFCAAVWDALAQSAARDLAAYRETCEKLWRPFLEPVVKGDFGTRDFSRLVVAQRRLFQDEGVLLDSIVAMEGAGASRSQALGSGVGEGGQSFGFSAPAPAPASSSTVTTTAGKKARSTDLPYYAKWLLLAAYLASFTPTRMDATFFMKTTERSTSKKGGGGGSGSRGGVRSRGGRGGGAGAGGGRGGRTAQKSRIPRHLLAPSTFTIDRLLAILHAILPHDLRSTCDVYTQVATLTSLRLLVRSGGIGSSAGGDFLEAGGKWRVGGVVSWEVVVVLARGLGFDIGAYVDY